MNVTESSGIEYKATTSVLIFLDFSDSNTVDYFI